MTWDLDPVALESGLISIRWYGIFLTTALFVAFFHMRWLIESGGKSEFFDRIILSGFFGGMLGARLGHFAFYETDNFLESPFILFDISRPGLSSHGAILGMMIAFALCRVGLRLPLIWIYSRAALSYVLFAVIIRLGNFFNSEIVGKPTDVPWAIAFARIDDLPRHPVQLYESALCLVCYGLLIWLFRKTGDDMKTFASAVISLSALRLFTEVFKAPQSVIETELPMSIGQYLTLPLLALGLVLLVLSFRSRTAQIS